MFDVVVCLTVEGINLMSTLLVPPICATDPSVSLIPALRFSRITLPLMSGSQWMPKLIIPLCPDCLIKLRHIKGAEFVDLLFPITLMPS